MQEKRNKMLMLSLVVLVTITAAIWMLRGRTVETDSDRNLFNGFDVKSIDQVTLQSAHGVVNLKFDGSRWLVNEQYVADPAMIEVLFATVLQAVPKRPAPASRQDSIAAVLRKEGIQVTLQTEGAREISFSAGGNAAKTQAWFLRSDQKIPYLMAIPGYRVYVSGIFELNESGWRDKRIFAFNWRLNFKDLQTVYTRNKADNFSVALKDQMLTVQGLNVVDSARLNQYLNDVSQLAADEFVGVNPTLDSLSRTPAVMELSVHDVGRTYLCSFFPTQTTRDVSPG
ncbi:MAG: DUF4340 domain-containing protein [Chryseolinea sp.]